MFGLDVTNSCPVTSDFLTKLKENNLKLGGSMHYAAKFIHKIETKTSVFFDDAMPLAHLVETSLFELQTGHARVSKHLANFSCVF